MDAPVAHLNGALVALNAAESIHVNNQQEIEIPKHLHAQMVKIRASHNQDRAVTDPGAHIPVEVVQWLIDKVYNVQSHMEEALAKNGLYRRENKNREMPVSVLKL